MGLKMKSGDLNKIITKKFLIEEYTNKGETNESSI